MIQSSVYKNSHVTCKLTFYLYIYAHDDSNIFYPLIHHVALGEDAELDRIDSK